MNVLLLIDALGTGGAETHVCTLAAALTAQGHRVGVLSEGGASERLLAGTGVRIWHFPAPVRGRAAVWRLPCLVRFVRRLCRSEGFDVLHAHTRRTALLLRLALAAPAALAPPIDPRAPYRRRAMRRLYTPVRLVTVHARFAPRHRRLCYWGDATVAVSEDLAAHTAQAFSLPRSRIRVIPNGIDLARFCPPAARECTARTLRVSFASRLDEDCSAAAYALLGLVDAWQTRLAAQGLALSVCIVGGGRQLADIRRRAAAHPCVQVLGDCDRMERILQQTDVLIGVSRVALEGLACGCAVILAGNEGAKGLLTEQNFALCAKDNLCCRSAAPADLSHVLEEGLTDYLALTPRDRDTASARLRALVSSHCGDGRMAAETAALYRKTLTAHRRIRVLIGGYAGCGNLGDDAILRCLHARWQARAVPRDLLSHEPLDVPCATLRVEALAGKLRGGLALPCHDRRRPLTALRRADAFVLGGGALLQNCSRRGNRSLAYYLLLAIAARLCGCPWYIVSGGIGPLRGRMARAACAAVLRTARGLSVRDEPSAHLLRSLGLPPAKFVRASDPVLALKACAAEEVDEALRRLAVKADAPLVCVAPHGRTKDLTALIDALEHCAQDALPLYVAFDRREDAALCYRLRQRYGGVVVTDALLDATDAPERLVVGLFARARVVLTGRLHALILARLAGTPAAVFPPDTGDEKLTAFVKAHKGSGAHFGQKNKPHARRAGGGQAPRRALFRIKPRSG